MNHTEFFKLISAGLPRGAYVFHGEEEYVKEQAVQRVLEGVDPDFAAFNVSVMEKPSLDKLTNACETLPFFTDRRVVVCRGLDEGSEGAKYVEYFAGIPADTLLLIVFNGKLAANLAVYKYAVRNGTEVCFDALSEAECVKWCVQRSTKAGVVLEARTAQMIVRMLGTDLTNMVGEIDKLCDLVGNGGVITPRVVSLCVKPAMEVRIFDMLDMFAYGKIGDGMRALRSMFDGGEEALGISAFLCGRFKLMLEAGRGIDSGLSKRETVSKMEGNRYANEKAFDAARYFTQEELMELIKQLSDTAYMKISGRMREDRYVELTLMKHRWRSNPIR